MAAQLFASTVNFTDTNSVYLSDMSFLIHITYYANIFHVILHKNSSLLSITTRTLQDEIHNQKTLKLKKQRHINTTPGLLEIFYVARSAVRNSYSKSNDIPMFLLFKTRISFLKMNVFWQGTLPITMCLQNSMKIFNMDIKTMLKYQPLVIHMNIRRIFGWWVI
jgi:hypothetical protein